MKKIGLFKNYVNNFFAEEDGDIIQAAAVLVLAAGLIAALAAVVSGLKTRVQGVGDILNSAFDQVEG